MDNLSLLIKQVAEARQSFIATAFDLTFEQAAFKHSPETWCIAEIVEHMVWAEQGGINGIWKAAEGVKNKKPIWTGDPIHHGLSIEKIIERTWQEKEQVPEVAKPRWGGPVDYWLSSLSCCQYLLADLHTALIDLNLDLEQVIYPHVISGPLNVLQRLEFLRFHLNRHQKQIENIKSHADFPKK